MIAKKLSLQDSWLSAFYQAVVPCPLSKSLKKQKSILPFTRLKCCPQFLIISFQIFILGRRKRFICILIVQPRIHLEAHGVSLKKNSEKWELTLLRQRIFLFVLLMWPLLIFIVSGC